MTISFPAAAAVRPAVVIVGVLLGLIFGAALIVGAAAAFTANQATRPHPVMLSAARE